MVLRKSLVGALVASVLPTFCPASPASEALPQDAAFPNWPVRVLVGFSAGAFNDNMVRTITPKLRERLKGLGMPVAESSAKHFADVIAREIPQWTAVAMAANIKLD